MSKVGSIGMWYVARSVESNRTRHPPRVTSPVSFVLFLWERAKASELKKDKKKKIVVRRFHHLNNVLKIDIFFPSYSFFHAFGGTSEVFHATE